MREVVISPGFDGWRAAARRLLEEGASPAGLTWKEGAREAADRTGVEGGADRPPGNAGAFRVPRDFVELARAVARHPDPDRWALLYSVLWRLLHGDRELLRRTADAEVARLRSLGAARPPESPGAPLFPELAAPAPPRVSSGVTPLPEEGEASVPTARPFVPETTDLSTLRAAAASCRGCELYRDATQTVFGEGPGGARVVLVGEQPGDQEDRRGAPFVGPAGEVLDRALGEAGLDRSTVYVTNAVKHFKFVVQRGGRRIHQTPRQIEIGACRPWLEAELSAIRPELLLCLGATASKALLGPDFRLMKERGRFLAGTPWAPKVMATLHPSAVLRGETPSAQEALYGLLLQDLRAVAGYVSGRA